MPETSAEFYTVLTSRLPLCFYAFMRTTVELPPELMRKAKALAAERGESLKALLTRAVSSEVGRSKNHPESGDRVRLPIFGTPGRPTVNVTNSDIARALATDDSHASRPSQKSRKK